MNFYVWDYTRPETRAWWANRTAAIFNAFDASTAQWDGSEFQPGIAGWGFDHSNQTYASQANYEHGRDYLWTGSAMQAFTESRALWNQPAAVELSLNVPGLGPWRGDMQPFVSAGSVCLRCWHPSFDSCDDRLLAHGDCPFRLTSRNW